MAGPGNQTTLLSTISLPEFTDLVRRNWVTTGEFLPRFAERIYIKDFVGGNQGNTKNYIEYDHETYADVKQEGAPAQKAKVGVGYNVTVQSKTLAKQVDITIEDRVQNRYPEVTAKLESLTKFCANRTDLDLTLQLTFGTSTSYTDMNGNTVDVSVGDGLSLFNAAHTLAFSPITYRNRVAGDPSFSQTSFQSALLLAASNLYSNFGERRSMDFNTIWCWEDPTTMTAIQQLIESMADVDAVQAGVVNTYHGKYRMQVLPNLAMTAAGAYDSTKRQWWGIGAFGQGLMGWQGMYTVWMDPQLRTPAPGNNGEDIDTLDWTYTTVSMFGNRAVSGRGIIGSCPTS